MPLRLRHYQRVDDFLADAGAYLTAREAEHNLMLGLCSRLRTHPGFVDEPPVLMAVVGDQGVVGAALRTPPANLVLSEIVDPAAIPLLVDGAGPDLPGVTGPPWAARASADHWAHRTGGSWRIGLEERIYRLTAVRSPMPASGTWRLAVPDDRALLASWLVAFSREALGEGEVERDVDRRLDEWASGGASRRYWLWEDGGEAVSLVGAGGETPNGIRIGPVYTPPERRRHGYASNLTAAVSEAMLAEGRRFCFLYTDLANPTSNRIYSAIGYEPIADALMLRFAPLTPHDDGPPPIDGERPGR